MKTLYINSDWIFTVIKPGFLQYTQDIIEQFEAAGWKLDRTVIKQLTYEEAKKLYEVHRKETFYEELCRYMSSGVTRAIIYTRPGSVSDRTFKDSSKIKDGIRKAWGISDMKNVLHSSDSFSAMIHESGLYF